MLLSLFLCSCSADIAEQNQKTIDKRELEPNEVFQNGSFIFFENVEIMYNSGSFEIQNNREDDVIVTMSIVGVKNDGSSVLLQLPAFGGVDQELVEKDIQENGWSVALPTNRVRAGKSLTATPTIFDFSGTSSDYPSPDIDGDGFYDITFTIHPQSSTDRVTISTSDVESDIYKLKAE